MRALASLGVLSEVDSGRFALAPLGEALRSDAPGAARATILALAGDWWWRGWEHVLYCLETGKTGGRRGTCELTGASLGFDRLRHGLVIRDSRFRRV